MRIMMLCLAVTLVATDQQKPTVVATQPIFGASPTDFQIHRGRPVTPPRGARAQVAIEHVIIDTASVPPGVNRRSLTLTDNQIRAITAIAALPNQVQGGSGTVPEEYMMQTLVMELRRSVQVFRETQRQTACQTFSALTADQQTQFLNTTAAKQAFGIDAQTGRANSPCS